MFKLQGAIKVIMDTVQVTEKFSKREFVIQDTSSMYPQDILFQLTQDKTDLIEPYAEGEEIEVSFNLRGREWTSPAGEIKFFNTLEAWRIEKIGQSNVENTAEMSKNVKTEKKTASMEAPTEGEEEDDLPF